MNTSLLIRALRLLGLLLFCSLVAGGYMWYAIQAALSLGLPRPAMYCLVVIGIMYIMTVHLCYSVSISAGFRVHWLGDYQAHVLKQSVFMILPGSILPLGMAVTTDPSATQQAETSLAFIDCVIGLLSTMNTATILMLGGLWLIYGFTAIGDIVLKKKTALACIKDHLSSKPLPARCYTYAGFLIATLMLLSVLPYASFLTLLATGPVLFLSHRRSTF